MFRKQTAGDMRHEQERCHDEAANHLLNYLNIFHGEMFKLKAKFDADSLLYLLSRFECDSHTVHVLT